MTDEVEQPEGGTPEDGGADGPTDAATNAYVAVCDGLARWRRFLAPYWPSRVGPDAPVSWFTPVFTAVAAFVVAPPFRLAFDFVMNQPRHNPPGAQVSWPPAWRIALMRWPVTLWYGALTGLGLVIADRLMASWRRPIRWAVGLGVVAALLHHLLPAPPLWRHLGAYVSAHGLPAALGWPHSLRGLTWLLLAIASECFIGVWLARAVTPDGRYRPRLAWAGMEASLILGVIGLPYIFYYLTHAPAPFRMAVAGIWAFLALGLLQSGTEGALMGLAIALGLPRARHIAGAAPPAAEDGPAEAGSEQHVG